MRSSSRWLPNRLNSFFTAGGGPLDFSPPDAICSHRSSQIALCFHRRPSSSEGSFLTAEVGLLTAPRPSLPQTPCACIVKHHHFVSSGDVTSSRVCAAWLLVIIMRGRLDWPSPSGDQLHIHTQYEQLARGHLHHHAAKQLLQLALCLCGTSQATVGKAFRLLVKPPLAPFPLLFTSSAAMPRDQIAL